MTSIDFPEANMAIAKDQPQYRTLYGHYDFSNSNGEVFICFELTDEEIEEIVRTRKLWYAQSTFGRPFAPIRVSPMNPFVNPVKDYPPPMDENRVAAEVWDKTHYVNTSEVEGIWGPCRNCNNHVEKHFFSSHQCELNPKVE